MDDKNVRITTEGLVDANGDFLSFTLSELHQNFCDAVLTIIEAGGKVTVPIMRLELLRCGYLINNPDMEDILNSMSKAGFIGKLADPKEN